LPVCLFVSFSQRNVIDLAYFKDQRKEKDTLETVIEHSRYNSFHRNFGNSSFFLDELPDVKVFLRLVVDGDALHGVGDSCSNYSCYQATPEVIIHLFLHKLSLAMLLLEVVHVPLVD
jgi:hypothetical protein